MGFTADAMFVPISRDLPIRKGNLFRIRHEFKTECFHKVIDEKLQFCNLISILMLLKIDF